MWLVEGCVSRRVLMQVTGGRQDKVRWMSLVSGLHSSGSELRINLTSLPIRHEALLALEGPLLYWACARVVPARILDLRDILLGSTRWQKLIQCLKVFPFRL